MKKLIFTVVMFFAVCSVLSAQKTDFGTVRFAYKADKGNNVFILDDALDGSYEIIVDELVNFQNSGENYLQDYVKSYLDKNPAGVVKDSNGLRFTKVNAGTSEISKLSKFNGSTGLRVSTSSGVYDGSVSSYYLNCCDGFMAGIFYPVLKVNSFSPSFTEDYKQNLYIITENPSASAISFSEETDMSLRHGVFDALYKLYNVQITKGEETNEEISIFSGSFTAGGEKQYLVSYRDHPDFENFASGVFIMDKDYKMVNAVMPFTPKDFYYNKAIGTVDVNGDGISEIIIETGYYEGSGYELWGYADGKFQKITEGFFFGV